MPESFLGKKVEILAFDVKKGQVEIKPKKTHLKKERKTKVLALAAISLIAWKPMIMISREAVLRRPAA